MAETSIQKTWRMMAENTAKERAASASRNTEESKTVTDAQRFEFLYQRIERYAKAFAHSSHDLGAAMLEMKTTGLYRQKFDTWEACVESIWGMTRQHAHALMNASEVYKVLQINGISSSTLDATSARAVGEIAKEPDPVKQVEDFKAASENGQPPTQSGIKKARESRVAKQAENRSTVHVEDPATGEMKPEIPKQLHLNFDIAAPTDDLQWFKALTKEERGAIVTNARRMRE